MRQSNKESGLQIRTLGIICFLLVGPLLVGSTFGERVKSETIAAQAIGTGTQLGQNVGISVIIYETENLVDAFTKGQNRGLVNALTNMKAVGHISILGTLGYDLSYIRLIPTPTGRKIRFITNRQIRFGEAFFDTQSQSFNLTAGELGINDQDKSKNTGLLYPAAQLVIHNEGQLQIDLSQNPWKLVDLIDWKGTPARISAAGSARLVSRFVLHLWHCADQRSRACRGHFHSGIRTSWQEARSLAIVSLCSA